MLAEVLSDRLGDLATTTAVCFAERAQLSLAFSDGAAGHFPPRLSLQYEDAASFGDGARVGVVDYPLAGAPVGQVLLCNYSHRRCSVVMTYSIKETIRSASAAIVFDGLSPIARGTIAP